MKKLFLISILIFISVDILAQHITICKAYTQTGEPIDIIYSKNISLNQTVCFLLSIGNKKILNNSVILNIDLSTVEYKQNQFNKVYKLDQDKNWLASNFKFTKEGKYEIYFTDVNKNKLTSTNIIVGNYKESTRDQSTYPTNYNNVEAVFCDNVLSGVPVNPKRNVSLKSDEGLVYLYLKCNSPFNTGRIHVTIMRKKNYSIDYDEFVASKKYQIDPNWEDFFFKYTFTKTGEYKFSVVDEKELLIKTAYITVIN